MNPTTITGTLPPLPSLDGVKRLGWDTETDIEGPIYDHHLFGVSYYLPDGRKGYVSTRHPNSLNYEEWAVKEWIKNEVRGKELVVANAKHEVHIMKNEGISLEEQGNTMCDVFHQAALLDDHRYRLNMDLLTQEVLPEHTKIVADHKNLYLLPADLVAPIAIEDAELNFKIDAIQGLKITAEELDRVLNLENDLVYATCEMERNGTYIDVEKLMIWRVEVEDEFQARILFIHRETGLKIAPGSWQDMARLFNHLGLQYPMTEPTNAHPDGCPSFPEEWLETVAGHWVGTGKEKKFVVDRPVVNAALEARQLKSMKNKYLDKYMLAVRPDGLLRYSLHQLRGDEHGTITGRYSCSGKKGEGANIQQVSKKEKQPLLLQRWNIRELFIPPKGRVWASADASQIEYRFFAHYAAKMGMDRLASAYRADPWIDFHSTVVEWTGLIRDHAKNVNFAKLYGGGVDKIAGMCKLSESEGRALVNKYDREFPEAKRLVKMASNQAETLGFVRTILGRRRRYIGTGERFYSALNSVFQGGAADMMKIKILESYRNRKRLDLTMRFTVHDESDGDFENSGQLKAWEDLLNTQSLDMHVPIMWKGGTGANWGEAH